ncbi:hypothetical protein JYU34_004926 [Plutella xylostella]|uniref:Apolipoprotein M n=1 Tax=Plutella xylostella TaxID=51655 RepID=A0ABQ7QVI5_PLUXY|nr:hypothetical protein JYU34_004926 [Plutella xylostella]
MWQPTTLLLILLIAQSQGHLKDDGKCNGFQSNFSFKSVIGSWHVVAIVPEALPKNHSVSCYQVDFSETDVGGLRWLVNQTIDTKIKPEILSKVGGLVIRQRYHSQQPFDVWSKAVEGVNGCFEQVLSLNHTDKKDINRALTQNERMQLHLLTTKHSKNPLLLQMLWSKMITAVIYSRNKDVNMNQLLETIEFLKKLRGAESMMEPTVCDELLSDKLA